MPGESIAPNVQHVRFYTSELLELRTKPGYELRFDATAAEVAAWLKRDEFLLDKISSILSWGTRE